MSELHDSLPEDLRENEHLATFQDAGQLASEFVKIKTTPFIDNVDEDIRDKVKEFKSANDLAKAYAETSGKVPVVPESADQYTYEFPEGVPVDETDNAAFKETAKKLGLTQSQYEGLINYDIARTTAALEKYDGQRKEAIRVVAGELEKSDEEVKSTVEKVVNAHPNMKALAGKFDVSSDPDFIRYAMWLASAIGEDTLRSGQAGGGQRRSDDGRPIIRYPTMESQA